MQPRPAPRARRTPRRWRLLCAALTLHSTWPHAQPLAAEQPLALRLSVEIARAVDVLTHAGEPLALRRSDALSDAPSLPAGAPLPLRLAILLRSDPYATGEERRPLSIDITTAQPVFYGVRVNQQEYGVARLLRLPDGRLLARRADLEEWRLRLPAGQSVLFAGEEHYPLDAFRGITYNVNELAQEVNVEIAAAEFASTVIEGIRMRPVPAVLPAPGGFVNYDLFFNAMSGMKRLDGVFEGAFFNRYGIGASSFLAQDMSGEPRGIRLETAWRRDFLDRMKTLVVGDTIGSSGIWGRPVRFGGVAYATNFATNPRFVTLPLPGVQGEAALPTTTELYVDGMLRQRSSVPPGPFRIDNVPVYTGQGEVRLVVRDLLGREQVITLPYYASTQLLRAGLSEESYELGAIRNNFGFRSHDYGRVLAAYQHRRGFTDRLTGEARVEALSDQQTAGGGGSAALGQFGIVTGAAAVSHSPRGIGELAFAGFERQALRGINFGVRSQWTSPDFAQLGLQPGQRAPVRVASGNVGYSAGRFGAVGVAYIRQDNRDQPGNELVSASYSLDIGRGASLMLFAFKSMSGDRSHSVGLTLSMGVGERGSGSANFVTQPGLNEGYVQFQQNPPLGTGSGYRVLAGGGSHGDREEAAWLLQTDVGTYAVEAGRADEVTAFRASASGAIAVVGGRPFLARTLTDGFAVAHVPGFANVGVYLNNQIVTRTDAAGYAMLPRLLPYQENPIRIDTADLPLDTRIESVQLDAIPYYRSGMLLTFPVQRANGALVTLVLDDGTPVPVGATVSVPGAAGEFPVAQRGEVYVTGLSERNRLRAQWQGRACEVELDLGGQLGTQPRIGPLTCAAVQR